MSQDCIFCKIINGDIPADVLYQDDDVLAFNDISPQAPTHILVIPKNHISGPEALGESDETLVGKLVRVGTDLAKERGLTDGYRLVMNNGERAGQTVFHLHMHVLGGRTMTWPPG
ncbi:MAG: histidine triad nucleotide-binding protein [Candidatus Marinimicrobia bacterium]|nr:histidine triad nucleotide-binding protein [Candidatus Neomarinimicrobiota bacterium]MCF7850546.1 histidine triad nucleotide-binding protein [Candidatus Neomarinimicrobiota bacterium]MCF7904120.1 histidine triad nucleotide-binding protein [Candidatus Neomarinimicrobiota bacterium]